MQHIILSSKNLDIPEFEFSLSCLEDLSKQINTKQIFLDNSDIQVINALVDHNELVIEFKAANYPKDLIFRPKLEIIKSVDSVISEAKIENIYQVNQNTELNSIDWLS